MVKNDFSPEEKTEISEIKKRIGDTDRTRGDLIKRLKQSYPEQEIFEITEEMLGRDLVWKCR